MKTETKILDIIRLKIAEDMNQARKESKDLDSKSLRLYGMGKLESLQMIYNFTLKLSANIEQIEIKEILNILKAKIKEERSDALYEVHNPRTKGAMFYANGKSDSLDGIYNFTFTLKH